MAKCFSILSIMWGVVTLLRYLRSKARKLHGKTQNLQNLKEDLTQRAETLISEDPTKSKQMSRQLQIWFIQVEDLVLSCQMIQDKSEKRQRSFTSSGCGCRLNYKLAKEAVELLRRVEQTIKRGNGFSDEKLVSDVLDLKVEFIPMYFDVVGQEDELKRALQLIEDDDDSVGVVGICGEAGVGKTTLLKRINNYFYGKENAGSFDFVIFLRVGGDGSNLCIQQMQKDIGQGLGLFSLSENGDEIYQARQIFKSLQFKNFLLLLDDVWEKIDLVRVGITPLNSCVDKKQKVVITTRDETVAYSYPRGRVVQMGLLSREESWELFRKHVNDKELLKGNEEIHTLAGEMADQCGGLPSQLSSVGKSMAAAKMDYQWRNAKRKRILDTLESLETKGKSLEDQIEELERMRDIMKSKPYQERPPMEYSSLTKYYFNEIEKHLQSSSTKLQDWKSLLSRGGFSCASIPSSSSSNHLDTSHRPCLSCEACKGDYNLCKEMCELLDRGEKLKKDVDSIVIKGENAQLVSRVSEFVSVIVTLGDKVDCFNRDRNRLGMVRQDLEKRIKVLENSGRESDLPVSYWFREAQKLSRSLEEASPDYRSIVEKTCINGQRAPCSSTCFASLDNACDACWEKYALGKKVENLIHRCKYLLDQGTEYLGSIDKSVGHSLRKLKENCNSLQWRMTILQNAKDIKEKKVRDKLKKFQQLGRKMEPRNLVVRGDKK